MLYEVITGQKKELKIPDSIIDHYFSSKDFCLRGRMSPGLVVPATDPRIADTLAQERTVQAYAIINDTPTWLSYNFV